MSDQRRKRGRVNSFAQLADPQRPQILFCRGDVFVTQHELNAATIDPILYELRGKGVPELVEIPLGTIGPTGATVLDELLPGHPIAHHVFGVLAFAALAI